MEKLCVWRNPDGDQENWFGREVHQRVPSPEKLILAECGFALIAAFGVIETVVTGVLWPLACLFQNVNENLYTHLTNRVISSFFSTAWASVNLICNVFYPNLLTDGDTAVDFGILNAVVILGVGIQFIAYGATVCIVGKVLGKN